jgi:hypothetical protein
MGRKYYLPHPQSRLMECYTKACSSQVTATFKGMLYTMAFKIDDTRPFQFMHSTSSDLSYSFSCQVLGGELRRRTRRSESGGELTVAIE